MDEKILNQIKNAEIDIQPYDPLSRALPTAEEKIQRRESLLHSGLITPIIITIDSNGKALIVDGNLRYNLIRELKKEGNWSDSLPVLKISLDKAKVYRGIQTNHKNYTKFQLAIFGAYNYWDEVEKDSLLRRQQGKKASGKKGKTSEIVGCMSGVNEKYAQYAHELLEIDAEFFYNTFFIKRYSLKKNSIKELISLFKTDKKRTLNIIEKIKELVENPESTNESKDIYETAVIKIFLAENQCYNQSDIVTYEDIDIEDVVHINEVPHTKKNTANDKSKKIAGYAELNQTQHIRHAQKNIQLDINNEIIKAGSIGLVFQYEPPEDMLNLIKVALKNCKLEPTVINTTDEFKTFKEINDNSPI